MNNPSKAVWQTASSIGLLQCRVCNLLSRRPAPLTRYDVIYCPRCKAPLHLPEHSRSIEITWALVLAATILYIPANILPIMSFITLGNGKPDTIISGVYRLWEAGQWPLAVIVFTASIVVPLVKLVALSFLLISMQLKSRWRQRDRMMLYKFIDYIGRWSMVDLFVISILTGLVKFGNIATVEANAGSLSFATVVVLTMLAARTLDEHLIWDIPPAAKSY